MEGHCVICLEDMEGEDVVCLPCTHAFHGACLNRMRDPRCPVCRAPIDGSETGLDTRHMEQLYREDEQEHAEEWMADGWFAWRSERFERAISYVAARVHPSYDPRLMAIHMSADCWEGQYRQECYALCCLFYSVYFAPQHEMAPMELVGVRDIIMSNIIPLVAKYNPAVVHQIVREQLNNIPYDEHKLVCLQHTAFQIIVGETLLRQALVSFSAI